MAATAADASDDSGRPDVPRAAALPFRAALRIVRNAAIVLAVGAALLLAAASLLLLRVAASPTGD
ncbi:MAG: hypothetical protein IPK07_25280 [Deltaproteobacteria bacterium]|nr:hypothetical protein [Deltaproteobacteria bacterium]